MSNGAKFLVFLGAVIFIAIFSGKIKFFSKRFKLKRKIKKCCKRHGYKLTVNGSFFANFESEKADLTVETKSVAYVVKLVGAKHRSHYDLVDASHYNTTWLLFNKLRSESSRSATVHEKKPYVFGTLAEDKIIPIILFNPVAAELTYKGEGTGNGDFVCEGFLYNLTGFIGLLEGESLPPKKRKKVYGE